MYNDSDSKRDVPQLDLGLSSLLGEEPAHEVQVDLESGEAAPKATSAEPTSRAPAGGALDLGISELLIAAPGETVAEPQVVPDIQSDPRDTAAATASESSARPLPQIAQVSAGSESEPRASESAPAAVSYQSLVNEKRWSEISSICEKKLSGEPLASLSGAEARLWWIFSQSRLGAIPVSLLVSRFDAITDLLACSPSPELKRHQPGKLYSLACSVAQELADNLERGSSVELAEELRLRANALNVLSMTQAPVVPPSDQLNGQAAIRKPELPSQHPEPDALPAQPVRRPDAANERAARLAKSRRAADPRRSWLRLAGGGALAAVSLLLSIFLWPDLGGIGFEELDSRRHVKLSTGEFKLPSAIPPLSEPLKGVRDLDAIFYDMSALVSQPLTPLDRAMGKAAPQSGSIATGAPAEQPAGEGNGRRRLKKTLKERIDTTYPRESAAVRANMRAGEEPPQSDFDFPPHIKRRSGDREGAGEARDSSDSFSRRRVAIIMQGTSVYSAPTYMSKIIDHLGQGDRVLAVKRHGQWLEIESSRGAGGFVPSADVAGY